MPDMFGLPSLGKLLLLIAIVLAVWYGFKWIGRLDAQRKAAAKRSAAERRGSVKRRSGSESVTEEMVQCPACETYVLSRSTGTCGRPDCPY